MMEGFGPATYILDGKQLSRRFLPFAELPSQVRNHTTFSGSLLGSSFTFCSFYAIYLPSFERPYNDMHSHI
jgi:hypothetical protein